MKRNAYNATDGERVSRSRNAKSAVRLNQSRMEITDVQHFWRIHVRFRAAKYLIEIGLWAMPECKYKIDLVRAMQRVHGKLLGIRENEGLEMRPLYASPMPSTQERTVDSRTDREGG